MLSRFGRFPMLCHCNLFHSFVGSVKRLYEHQNYKIQMNPSKWKWKMLSKIRCFMQNPHKTITIGAAFSSEASMPCGNQQPKNSGANGGSLLHNHHRHHWCVLFSHGRSEQSSMDPLHTKGAPSTPWTKTPTINAAKVNSLTHTANLNEIVWNLEWGMEFVDEVEQKTKPCIIIVEPNLFFLLRETTSLPWNPLNDREIRLQFISVFCTSSGTKGNQLKKYWNWRREFNRVFLWKN